MLTMKSSLESVSSQTDDCGHEVRMEAPWMISALIG